MGYTINVPMLGKMDAPDPQGLGTAPDRDVLAALYTPTGCVDPVAFQVLVDRGLCFRGDFKADIERRIAAREGKRAMCPHEHAVNDWRLNNTADPPSKVPDADPP